MPAHRLNRPYRLPLSHLFCPQGLLFTMPRRLSIDSRIASRRTPEKAKDLLEAIQQHEGNALPGYIGGRTFQNWERRLPRGHYREYDVNPKIRGRPRDAERIVIEQDTGRAYYTDNHYRTFMPLNGIP
jgi:ribonuclease T1